MDHSFPYNTKIHSSRVREGKKGARGDYRKQKCEIPDPDYNYQEAL
jgi:hypothetical protein